MSTLWISLFAALAIVGAAFRFQRFDRSRRLARLVGLELRPNCLLTRHPIAFVTTTRSLFQFDDPFAIDVPAYLREHGYEVLVLEIPKMANDSSAAVVASLDTMSERCHLIASSAHQSTLEAVAHHKHPMAASLTVVTDPRRPLRNASSQGRPSLKDFKPLPSAVESFEIAVDPERKPFWFESCFLELAISLAERDAMLSD